MVLPKDSFQMDTQEKIVEAWRDFIRSMEEALDMLDRGMDQAAEETDVCTHQWCIATEHMLDELGNRLFSISEPRWASEKDSEKLRKLKRRLHDLYAKYKTVSTR